jgi:transcriptional regulator with XRE-family HTH domain
MRRKLVETQEMYLRVGKAIYRARNAECMSRAELARRIGCTAGHLQAVEDGITACSLHLLVAIADDLDLTLDELVPVAIDDKELMT